MNFLKSQRPFLLLLESHFTRRLFSNYHKLGGSKWILNHRRKLALISGGLASSAFAFYHMDYDPFIGRWRFIPLTDSQLEHVCDANLESSKNFIAYDDSKQIYNAIGSVMSRLLLSNNLYRSSKALKWRITLENIFDPMVQCKGLKNIVINAGLLYLIDNEDELAMILSHEIAHRLCKHVLDNIRGRDSAITAALSLLWYIMPNSAMSWLSSKLDNVRMSQDHELEADSIALQLLTRAGYNPQKAIIFYRKNAVVLEMLEHYEMIEADEKPVTATNVNEFPSVERFLSSMQTSILPPSDMAVSFPIGSSSKKTSVTKISDYRLYQSCSKVAERYAKLQQLLASIGSGLPDDKATSSEWLRQFRRDLLQCMGKFLRPREQPLTAQSNLTPSTEGKSSFWV